MLSAQTAPFGAEEVVTFNIIFRIPKGIPQTLYDSVLVWSRYCMRGAGRGADDYGPCPKPFSSECFLEGEKDVTPRTRSLSMVGSKIQKWVSLNLDIADPGLLPAARSGKIEVSYGYL